MRTVACAPKVHFEGTIEQRKGISLKDAGKRMKERKEPNKNKDE